MTIISAWLQDEDYPARWDRHHIKAITKDQERVISTIPGELYGLVVAPHSPSADGTVDIGTGRAYILGDDEPNQGFYLFDCVEAENLPMPAPPGSDSRIDLVIARINDLQAGGAAGPPVALFDYVQGVSGPAPTAPTIPDTAIGLVSILRTSGESAIELGAITRIAPDSAWPIGSGPSLPPAGYGVPGDVWIVTA